MKIETLILEEIIKSTLVEKKGKFNAVLKKLPGRVIRKIRDMPGVQWGFRVVAKIKGEEVTFQDVVTVIQNSRYEGQGSKWDKYEYAYVVSRDIKSKDGKAIHNVYIIDNTEVIWKREATTAVDKSGPTPYQATTTYKKVADGVKLQGDASLNQAQIYKSKTWFDQMKKVAVDADDELEKELGKDVKKGVKTGYYKDTVEDTVEEIEIEVDKIDDDTKNVTVDTETDDTETDDTETDDEEKDNEEEVAVDTTYSDATMGFPTGDVDSRKAMVGGTDGNWNGSMPRALAIAKMAKDNFGVTISSQKRSRKKTSGGNVSQHWVGAVGSYAVDLNTPNVTAATPKDTVGDELWNAIVDSLGKPGLKSGKWQNVKYEGYRYNMGWRTPGHFDHIHVGVRKAGSSASSKFVTTTATIASIKAGTDVVKKGETGGVVGDIQRLLQANGYSLSKYGDDDDFGTETEDAVLAFQYDTFNKKGSGKVDKDTLIALAQGAKEDGGEGSVDITPGAELTIPITTENTYKIGNKSYLNGSEKTSSDYIIRYLVKTTDLTVQQAAGIAGNIATETIFTWETGIVGDNGQSFGLCQWHKNRAEDLLKEKPNNYLDPNVQLDFIWKELTTKNLGLTELKQAKSAGAAAKIFMLKFEKPNNKSTENQDKRAKHAQTALNKYNSTKEDDTEEETITYDSGDTYKGEMKDGKRNGEGTYTWASGSTYVGEWKDGKRNGQGTMTWAYGDKYIGEWKEGKENGQGTKTYDGGSIYVGEWKDGKMHGQGTFTYEDGDKYEGEWKDDAIIKGINTYDDGKMIFTGYFNEEDDSWDKGVKDNKGFKDGSRAIGEWKDSKFVAGMTLPYFWEYGKTTDSIVYEFETDTGDEYMSVRDEGVPKTSVKAFPADEKILKELYTDDFISKNVKPSIKPFINLGTVRDIKTITYDNGAKYKGEMKDNKRNGEGTYTFVSGNKYEGEFKDGKYNGQGTYTSVTEKYIYVGEFKDNKFNGQGTKTWDGGDKETGIWKDGKFVGE